MSMRSQVEGRSRRTFLKEMAGLGGALVAAGALPDALSASPLARYRADPVQPTVDRIGVQLYTVRDQLQLDFERTVERVAQVGYRQVEFAGYYDRPPAQIRALLDRLGLTAPSTHIGLAPLRSDFDAQVGLAQTLGHRYITVPSLGRENPENTVDGWKRVADEFNTIGARLKSHGIGIGFHNHRDEFAPVGGGQTGMDVFVSSTDPEVVAFELDLGWAIVAGQNPVDWFRRYPGRFKMWHVKDMGGLQELQATTAEGLRNPPPPRQPGQAAAPTAEPRPGGPVPVGAGEIDFKPTFDAWRESGLEHFFVEDDGAARWPGGSFTSIATSFRNLKYLLT